MPLARGWDLHLLLGLSASTGVHGFAPAPRRLATPNLRRSSVPPSAGRVYGRALWRFVAAVALCTVGRLPASRGFAPPRLPRATGRAVRPVSQSLPHFAVTEAAVGEGSVDASSKSEVSAAELEERTLETIDWGYMLQVHRRRKLFRPCHCPAFQRPVSLPVACHILFHRRRCPRRPQLREQRRSRSTSSWQSRPRRRRVYTLLCRKSTTWASYR